MKYSKRLLYAVSAVILLSVYGCKDKPADQFPRETYVLSENGAVLSTEPGGKSDGKSVIPFGTKIVLTAAPDQKAGAKPAYYKTDWKGAAVWIPAASVGAKDQIASQIKSSFAAKKAGFPDDFAKSVEGSKLDIIKEYTYPGGEMEPARIYFFSDGIMLVNSKMFTENYSDVFFRYQFLNDGRLLKIKFVDPKLKFSVYADIENSSKSIFNIDRNDSSITYHVKDRGIFLMNWGFREE